MRRPTRMTSVCGTAALQSTTACVSSRSKPADRQAVACSQGRPEAPFAITSRLAAGHVLRVRIDPPLVDTARFGEVPRSTRSRRTTRRPASWPSSW